MGAPAALFFIYDRSATDRARLSLPAIDAQIFLILSFFAAAVNKIENCRAAIFQSFCKDRANGFIQALALLAGHAAATPGWADTRQKQGFIGVNVAQSGQTGLVEQHTLA